MIISYTSTVTYLKSHPQLGLILPLYIFTIFIVMAVLIGRKYSCAPVANLYYWGGLASIPLLFSVPFICSWKFHLVFRLLFSLLSTGLGILVWLFSYAAAGMYFMCRLF